MEKQSEAWDVLAQNWQENDADLDTKVPSDTDLVNQLNKQRRAAKFEIAISFIVSLALAGYIASEYIAGLPSLADTILYAIFFVVTAFFGFYSLFSVRHFGAASTNNTNEYISIMRKQAKARLRAVLYSRILCSLVLLMSLSLLVLIGYVGVNRGLLDKHYLVGSIAIGCSLLSLVVVFWTKTKKQQINNQIAFLDSLGK